MTVHTETKRGKNHSYEYDYIYTKCCGEKQFISSRKIEIKDSSQDAVQKLRESLEAGFAKYYADTLSAAVKRGIINKKQAELLCKEK